MKKILTIASSLGASFKRFATSYNQVNDNRIHINTISAHGAAFWQGDSIECSENGVMNFKNGMGGAGNDKISYKWVSDFSDNPTADEGISASILDYDHVILLDALFVARGR